MKVTTRSHTIGSGWSQSLPAELDSTTTVVFAFGAPSYVGHAGAFDDLTAAFPTSRIIGCSTAGEIHGTSIRDESMSVAVARFERTGLSNACAPITRDTSFEAGEQLGRALMADDLRGVLLLSNGNDVNGTQLAAGLQSIVGAIPVSGGLAADGTRFQHTWVIDGGRPRSGMVSAIGLHGSAIRLGHGSKGGWDKFGPERLITRSSGNVLQQLDGRPALELYKTYLGDLASGLPATALLYPLAIRTSRNAEQLVRTVLSHSEQDQTLTFAGDMPEGAYAQLMRANFDRLVEAASDAARGTATTAEAELCIAVSCVGRRLVLGERAEEETEAVAEVLPRGCALVGFYSNGELSPLGVGSCSLHNQTMTLTTFAEA
jgi:hypothetical protein